MQVDIIFFLAILIFSVILHEVAHGYVAALLGDPTARLAGRLSLNPRSHIDPMGSIIVPGLLMLGSGGALSFGWAKPVPYNPYNLRNFKWGSIAVALAGVVVNLIIAVIFGLLIRYMVMAGVGTEEFLRILVMITQINLILAIFNLIPIPPLDGSKILFAFLPYRFHAIQEYMEHNWLIFIVFVFFFAQYIISPVSQGLFWLITGFHM